MSTTNAEIEIYIMSSIKMSCKISYITEDWQNIRQRFNSSFQKLLTGRR